MWKEIQGITEDLRDCKTKKMAAAEYVSWMTQIARCELTISETFSRFTALDTAPKKYQSAGLRKNTLSKKAQEPVDPFQSGGLHDEDADAVRPPFRRDPAPAPPMPMYPGNLKRNHLYKNDVRPFLLVSSIAPHLILTVARCGGRMRFRCRTTGERLLTLAIPS